MDTFLAQKERVVFLGLDPIVPTRHSNSEHMNTVSTYTTEFKSKSGKNPSERDDECAVGNLRVQWVKIDDCRQF